MPCRTPWCNTAMLVLLTTITALVSPSLATCETRCESSIPLLVHLRLLWSQDYRSAHSWQRFLLFIANSENPAAAPLRAHLLQASGQFQDCVTACEHTFRKRSKPRTAEERPTVQFPWIQ